MKKNNIVFDVQTSMREFDSNGYLHVKLTPISKACVNSYFGFEIPGWDEMELDKDRIYYALRDPKELEKAANTFNGLPLLLEHHKIDAQNQPKEFIVGSTGTDARFEAPYLKNSLTITDAEAIGAVEDGSAKEISCAYSFIPDFTAGTFEMDGQKIHYDFIMRDIKGNHVALVSEGRAGHDVAVADKKPDKIKRSEILMNKRQRAKNKLAIAQDKKIIMFKRNRNKLAFDTSLGIEPTSEGFQKALNVIEAQIEGYDPREIGLEIDAEASIDEIIDKFMPGLDENTRNLYKGVLAKLKDVATVDEDIPNMEGADEDITVTTGASGNTKGTISTDDDWLTEKMKDPAFKEAFEMGVKYGTKSNDTPTVESKNEGGEGVSVTVSTDSIENMKRRVAADTKEKVMKELKEHYRALNKAANKVKPLTGEIADPLVFDSAKDIYAFALKCAGKKPESYDKSAYEGMVDILLDITPHYAITNDNAFYSNILDNETDKIFQRLDNIQ